MGSVYFGLVACREVVLHLDDIAGYVRESLDELVKAAAAHGSTTPAARRRTATRAPD
jgi:hypothetical protein